MQRRQAERYRFGDFDLDPGSGVLTRRGVEVPIRPKLVALLAHLIRNRDRTVTKAEVLDAIWGNTHVSEATLASTLRDLRHVLGDGGVEPRIVQTVRGRGYRFSHPVEASEGASAEATASQLRVPGPPSVFVGRKRLLADAGAQVARVGAGAGEALFLCGEPGMGKTSAALEIARIAERAGFEVHLGRCLEEAGAPVHWPWVQIVRGCIAARDVRQLREAWGGAIECALRLLPEHAGDRPAREASGAEERFRLFDGVTQLLLAAAAEQPRLLLVDDLHRAGASSIELLAHVLRSIGRAPILLLGTYREQELTPDHPLSRALGAMHPAGERRALTGLAPAEVGQLIAALSGHAASAETVSTVHARTGGNPLFVAEITRSLLHEVDVSDAELAARVATTAPAGVREVIRDRVRRLPEPAERVLEVAAALGREFDVDLVMGGCSELDASGVRTVLDAGVSSGLLGAVPGALGRLRFAHILTRDAIYEGIPGARRAELHHEVGETIETLRACELEAHLDELALHFAIAAPLGEVERAVTYARESGESALAQAAYAEAGERFEAALSALRLRSPGEAGTEIESALRDRAELLVLLGRARWEAGDTESARATFEEAVAVARRLGSARLLAHAALGYAGRTDATPGVNRRAIALLEQSLGALPDEEASLGAEVMARLGTELYYADVVLCDRYTREALAKAEALEDPGLLAYALSARHYALLRPEIDPRQRQPITGRLVLLADLTDSKDMRTLGLQEQVLDHLELGEVDRLDRALRAFSHCAVELRQPFFLWMSEAMQGMRALLDGRVAEAERRAQETLARGQGFASPNALSLFAAQLFCVRQEQGRLAELEPLLRREIRERQVFPAFRAGLAAVYAQMGRRAEARDAVEQFMAEDLEDVPRDQNWLSALGALTPACALVGDERQAQQLYERLEPYSDRFIPVAHGAGCLGAVAHHLGRLALAFGSLDVAEERFEDALIRHRRAGAHLLLAHSQREFGAMLWKRGGPRDRVRGRALLRAATETYRRLGLSHATAEARSITGGA